jgi:heptosyltransferase-2
MYVFCQIFDFLYIHYLKIREYACAKNESLLRTTSVGDPLICCYSTGKRHMILREFFLLFLCYSYALVRGRATAVPASPKRVIIVQMAKLGDMVCTTPMFRAVKRRYPETHLTVIGNKSNKEILQYNPDVDDYITFGGVLSAIRAVRRSGYDFGVSATPSEVLLAVLYLGGVRTIAVPAIKDGYSPLETFAYRLLRHLVLTEPHHMGQYAPREYLRLLEPLNIHTNDTKKYLFYKDESVAEVHAILAPLHLESKNLVGVSPSSGNKIKQWPPERFAAVIDALTAERGVEVLVIGTERDKEEIEEMLSHVRSREHVHDLSTKLTIGGLKALMPKLSLFIAADTGPIYVAEAYGVPTVDIVGPMDEREQPPRGEKHLVVVPPNRKEPALHIMNAKMVDYKETRRQAESITIEMVLAACNKLLS